MPDFASRSEASTSCALLPMDDTMPRPVTTTRRMPLCSSLRPLSGWNRPTLRSVAVIDRFAVGLQHAIGDAKH